MLRRTIQIATIFSTITFIAMAVVVVRSLIAHDDFQLVQWNPATRTYTETRINLLRRGIYTHCESTTALPSDNTAAILTKVGPANSLLSHHTWPPASSDCPLFWIDHFRCTPSCGINTSGLSNCWTLEFRSDAITLILAVLPTIWLMKQIRKARQIRLATTRGFPVLEPIKS
jgi:hypothetical protein